MALIPSGFVGIPPQMILETIKALVYNPGFHVLLLGFGLVIAGLFGILEIYLLVRRRGR